jgi:DNA-binding HxlR family transcriptional regulator
METTLTPLLPNDSPECTGVELSLSDLIEQIGGKWAVLVIRQLNHGSHRFSELKRSIEGISQKMLTATLRDLERGGFISRTVTPSIPPRVDYELTELGLDLRVPLGALASGAVANQERVNAARERFAQREAAERAGDWSSAVRRGDTRAA